MTEEPASSRSSRASKHHKPQWWRQFISRSCKISYTLSREVTIYNRLKPDLTSVLCSIRSHTLGLPRPIDGSEHTVLTRLTLAHLRILRWCPAFLTHNVRMTWAGLVITVPAPLTTSSHLWGTSVCIGASGTGSRIDLCSSTRPESLVSLCSKMSVHNRGRLDSRASGHSGWGAPTTPRIASQNFPTIEHCGHVSPSTQRVRRTRLSVC